MGLFSKRKSRADRKAERKAVVEKAKLEAKLGARNDNKQRRAERRSQRKIDKQQIKTLSAQEKVAVKEAEKLSKDRFSANQVKKYLGVARVLAPVLAPIAYKGATFVRGQVDTRRAQSLGVGVEQLGQYSGHGAKLSARIANAETSAGEIVTKNGSSDAQKFADATRKRLDDLNIAVNAAEHMPTARRRAAHQAISTELSGIEADLLARLGVR